MPSGVPFHRWMKRDTYPQSPTLAGQGPRRPLFNKPLKRDTSCGQHSRSPPIVVSIYQEDPYERAASFETWALE